MRVIGLEGFAACVSFAGVSAAAGVSTSNTALQTSLRRRTLRGANGRYRDAHHTT